MPDSMGVAFLNFVPLRKKVVFSMKQVKLILSTLLFISFTGIRSFAADGGNMEASILKLINQYRAGKHLPALAMNDEIADAARRHSYDMATHKVPFGHDGFEQRTGRLIKDLKPANAAAENVAFGASSAREVVDMWLHSKGHRKNIEGNYNMTGIGIAADRTGKYYFTQIFINKQ
ncbi:CAP domain-containing protein [Chitinophagaceae bacterium MMS25-I14]